MTTSNPFAPVATETDAPRVDAADVDGDDSVNHDPTRPVVRITAPVVADSTPAVPVAPTPDSSTPPGQDEPVVIPILTESDFDREIAERDDAVKQAEATVRQAQQEVQEAIADRDDAIAAKARQFPPMTPAQSIQAHLKREQERRMERVAGTNAVNKQVGSKVLSTRSALDQAIGNRRKPQPPIVNKNPNV